MCRDSGFLDLGLGLWELGFRVLGGLEFWGWGMWV